MLVRGGARRFAGMLGLLLISVAAWAFAFRVVPGGSRPGPREVVVVAEAMTFVTPGGAAGPNPTLRFRAGERVRLVLENRDPGMQHDLAVPGWGFRTAAVEYAGTDRRILTVPDAPGTYEYFCSFHDRVMRGTAVIE